MPSAAHRKLGPDALGSLTDDELLDLQFRELDLQIEGTELALRIEQIYSELAARNLSFRPHFWLSDEWFTPDGIPGVAIPFYLAHPRLAKLELAQMLEVEGGDAEWCMRILRHEAGHAIDNAFNLRRRRQRRELFGSSRKPYPEFYTPKPYSKNFVLHLDSWYAQSHPDEDFAETFAVWLTPDAQWRAALSRLAGAEEAEVHGRADARRCAGKTPPVTNTDDARSAAAPQARRCGSTTGASAATTASTTRASTIATCGGCSRTRPSSASNMTAAQFLDAASASRSASW